MTFIADTLNLIGDLLVRPFGSAAAWAMFVLSGLAGLALLLIFKAVTNQRRLGEARRQLTGRLYEIGLFQDNLSVLFRIQFELARANLRYLAVTAPSLLVLIPVIILMLAQFDCRFGRRPFAPGEAALVTARLAPGNEALLNELALATPDGVALETLPVRDPSEKSVTWRVRVLEPGSHVVMVQAPDGRLWSKRLEAGGGLPRLAGQREQAGWHHLLFNPAEEPLPRDCPLAAISLPPPSRTIRYAGVAAHWLVAFCIFSLGLGLALKDLFGVEV